MNKIAFIALALLVGCATGSHVVTGTVHPAIFPDYVKVYTDLPANAEVIGVVNSSNMWLTKQPGMNSVVEQIKIEAAKIGANGVVINTQKNSQWDGAAISGTAIFVR
jgi:hypothetical protein